MWVVAVLWVCGASRVSAFDAHVVPVVTPAANATLPLSGYVNPFFTAVLPVINDAMAKYLPASYGNCNSDGPPAPCHSSSGNSDIFEEHKVCVCSDWCSAAEVVV